MKQKLCKFEYVSMVLTILTVFYLFITVYQYYENERITLSYIANNIICFSLLNDCYFSNIGVILNVLLPLSIINNIVWIVFKRKVTYRNVFFSLLLLLLFFFSFFLGIGGEQYNISMHKKNLQISSVNNNNQIEPKEFSSYIVWLKEKHK